MRKAIELVAGVRSVDIDLASRTATVIFDPESTTPAAIAQASAEAGYPAKAVSPRD